MCKSHHQGDKREPKSWLAGSTRSSKTLEGEQQSIILYAHKQIYVNSRSTNSVVGYYNMCLHSYIYINMYNCPHRFYCIHCLHCSHRIHGAIVYTLHNVYIVGIVYSTYIEHILTLSALYSTHCARIQCIQCIRYVQSRQCIQCVQCTQCVICLYT